MAININLYKKDNYYYCEHCDYTCHTKFLIKQHLTTKKHKNSVLASTGGCHTSKKLSKKISNAIYVCEVCNKKYKERSGLWRHKKICVQGNQDCFSEIEHSENDNSEIVSLMKNMIDPILQNIKKDNNVTLGLVKQMQTQNKIITDMIPKIGNNNNNRFNINVFLNEQCRDAINMSDFLNSLQIKLADLMYTKHNGLIEGISSVFVTALNKLETCQRPIHCTDVKRETLYIKDNNEWERENSKNKLHNAISKVAQKQRQTITEWEKANENWQTNPESSQEYINLVREVTKDVVPDENKIIKNIIKETTILKDPMLE